MPDKPVKSFSQRLLAIFGIAYDSQEDANITRPLSETADSSGDNGGSSDRAVLPKNLSKRYKFERILGCGGYGVVYLARDLIIGRLVALKILKKDLTASDQIYGHFLQEARIAGQLDHENIVVIYNVEEEVDSTCIVMEYLSEGNLAHRLKNDGVLDILDALYITKGILEGLSVAHEKRVIHRDVKPENILFDPKGRPKISDFGIAHLPVEEGGVHSEKEYHAVGTPAYMAPEQLQGSTEIDQRADIYSVGTILYEMLTLRKLRVYPRDAKLSTILRILEQNDPVSLRKLRRDISEDILEFFEKLCHCDRGQRFWSASDALEELGKILRKEEQKEPSESQEDLNYTTSRVALLEDVLRLLLVDGIMSPAERRELERRAERLNVSVKEARTLEEKIRREMSLPSLDALEAFQGAVTAMAAVGELSSKDRDVLRTTSERLGIGLEECEMIQRLVLEQRFD